MKSLQELIEEGKEVDLGYEVWPHPSRLMLISNEALPLIYSAPNEMQSLVELVQRYSELDYPKREKSDILNSWELIYKGNPADSLAEIYKIPLRDGSEIVVKICDTTDNEEEGSYYLRALIRTRKEDYFDTLIPYIASGEYIFMSLLPDIPSFDDFVEQHPELESEVKEALFNAQRQTNLEDVGFDETDATLLENLRLPTQAGLSHFEIFLFNKLDLQGGFPVKDTYVAKYNPQGKSLQEKYRFFIIDMMYDMNVT